MEVVSLQDRKHFVHEAWFQHHYGGIASFFEGMTIENILVPDYQNRIYFDAPSDPEAQIGKVRGRFRHSPVFVLDGRQYSLGTDPAFEREAGEDAADLDSVPFTVYPVRNPYDFSVENWYYDFERGSYASFRWISKMPWKNQRVKAVVPYYQQDFVNDAIIGFSLEMEHCRISIPFPPDDRRDMETMVLINSTGPLYEKKYIERSRCRRIFDQIETWVRDQLTQKEWNALLSQSHGDFFFDSAALEDEALQRLFSAPRLGLTYDPHPDAEEMRRVFGQLQTGRIPYRIPVLKTFCARACVECPKCRSCIVRDECTHDVNML